MLNSLNKLLTEQFFAHDPSIFKKTALFDFLLQRNMHSL